MSARQLVARTLPLVALLLFAAVPAAEAITRTREAFLRHRAGDWVMPSKVYLPSPPFGDFRAMPARGGLANISDAELRNAIVYMFRRAQPAGKKG